MAHQELYLQYFFGLTLIGDQYSRRDQDPIPGSVSKPKQYHLSQAWEGIYLTQREAECIQLCLLGMSMKAIGEELNLSARTIEFYLKNVKDKIGVRKKKDLITVFTQINFSQVQVF